jgi:hypothetical protein
LAVGAAVCPHVCPINPSAQTQPNSPSSPLPFS